MVLGVRLDFFLVKKNRFFGFFRGFWVRVVWIGLDWLVELLNEILKIQ